MVISGLFPVFVAIVVEFIVKDNKRIYVHTVQHNVIQYRRVKREGFRRSNLM